jgi:hypothetical protein
MRLLTAAAIAAILLPLAVNAQLANRTQVQGKVTVVGACWDTDGSVGACSCATFEMDNGKQYAITPNGSPVSTNYYNMALAAFQSGRTFAFWDIGPSNDRSCHFGNDNLPLHVIYAPAVW